MERAHPVGSNPLALRHRAQLQISLHLGHLNSKLESREQKDSIYLLPHIAFILDVNSVVLRFDRSFKLAGTFSIPIF
jgi:hypothetical protein